MRYNQTIIRSHEQHQKNVTVAYLGGTFDAPLHPGHIRMFRFARQTFGKVVVALNSDAFIKGYKGRAPLLTFAERREILEAFKDVDEVILNHGNSDSRPSIIQSGATHLVAGLDWAPLDKYYKQLGIDQKWLDSYQIEVVLFGAEYDQHGSDIKKRFTEPAKPSITGTVGDTAGSVTY